ncbi:hypothetical protein QJS10_CPA05g00353 [Acorus calamus]|uniref:Putative GTP diphosphokinase RSH1, chloroplastic n=1 Tax=Acorus calamus TaxID=4465 RepID=A0AAV9EUP4_ACOCL|nr:hypothetical protein QJS10_CPA05g00353 [Acorus calamus]
MASAPSMSVSVECVNLCRLAKGEGIGRYECSVLSCAWKAPRVLTGSLASTAHPHCPPLSHDRARRGRQTRDLKPTILYLSPGELKLVHDALKLAFEAHDGQKRRSGEPFIIHPVEVARILGELELDWESIAAGLLHDTVEDTNVVTFERIEKEFGATVRHIVEGETKVSKLGKLQCKDGKSSVQDVKADDLRQMFLAMTEEFSIALETLQVFAPLAKLLGMYQIKSELENLSFMYTNPHDYAELKKRVDDLDKEHEKELIEAQKILMQKIAEDQFLDLMTVKTEVRSICYHVLGLVHGIWTPIPRAMKDYLATPKPNGYQSLHTTVIPFLYESMFRLEVQIRTEEMDLIAERGIAAHYSGKGAVIGLVGHAMPNGKPSRGKTVCLKNADIALRIGWLNAIREWQEEFVGNMSSREFVDTIMRDLLGSRVFVFTPKGEIKNLPKGATVIDYAYQIHTEIGNKMVAAKVNGNLVSPMHVLVNAEVVEIITYNFLREQAALSATEITADAVKNFVADLDDEDDFEKEEPESSKESHFTWKKILAELSAMKRSHEDSLPLKINGATPKINGKHNKNLQQMSLKVNGALSSQGNGFAQLMHANIPMYKDVLPGLQSWQEEKIASWHNVGDHSIQWLSVICIDRRGQRVCHCGFDCWHFGLVCWL